MSPRAKPSSRAPSAKTRAKASAPAAGAKAAAPRAPALLAAAATTALPGIGPTMAARLAERDIRSVEDLLWFVPRRYDDARQVVPLVTAVVAAQAGQRITCSGIILSSRFQRRGRQRWLDVRLGEPEPPAAGAQAAQILVRWFNAYESMAETLAKGARATLSGVVQRRGLHVEMANPDILFIQAPSDPTASTGNPGRSTLASPIIPRYSDVPGVPAAKLRKACLAALDHAGSALIDGLPRALAARMGMVPLVQAITALHQPPAQLSPEQVELLNQGKSEWHRRLVFEDLFILGLAIARRRRARRADTALPCPATPALPGALDRALPFQLTGAQRRAIAAISADLAGGVPMNRLLQGDVGSGKTAVAFAAACQAISAGRQVALMAPTELLAEQHASTLSAWCQVLEIRAARLSSSTPRSERATTLCALADGHLQLIIGTHALLSEGVDFASLGLVIVDEQHRFGVAQRVELRTKGSSAETGAPHLLVMTATPIPRTLALTAYGDLDVTVIDELPPGREPPVTLVLSGPQARDRAHSLVRQRLGAGERIYVVCPLIEPNDDDDDGRPGGADVVSTLERMTTTFAPARADMVHGRMPQSQRDEVMQRFRDGGVDILVATTVIEVGVDVPQATTMVILDAHRFGLAQLHQLRGRVGRGGGASRCLLMTRGTLTPEAARRLAVMAETSDGFRIAEEDLIIRGPGELLGARQAGLPALRYGDLCEHGELLVKARDAAQALLAEDPTLAQPEHAATRRALALRTGGLALYGAESG